MGQFLKEVKVKVADWPFCENYIVLEITEEVLWLMDALVIDELQNVKVIPALGVSPMVVGQGYHEYLELSEAQVVEQLPRPLF